MKLSDVREKGVGRLEGVLFIVMYRCAADRTSGSTRITFEDGYSKDYCWDEEDPEVVYLGQGEIKVQIIY